MKRLVAAGVGAAIVLTVATAARVSDPTGHPDAVAIHHHHQHAVASRRTAARPRRPDALVIPALGVRAPLTATGAVGAPGSATLTIPQNIHAVAWWDGDFTNAGSRTHTRSPVPGQPGVALIAGHVDSAAAGPGALYHLASLKAGDTVRVTLHGRTTAWRVARAPQLAPKTALPQALFRTGGAPRLAVVTCGGGFDAATGHYLDNVIVWAVPASAPS